MEFNSTTSYLGRDIKAWALENCKTVKIAEILVKHYFSNTSPHHANLDVYYFVLTNKDDAINIARDNVKSPRKDIVSNQVLDDMINNDNSFLGKEITKAVLDEINAGEASEPIKNFYSDIIVNNKYGPKGNVYYFLRWNTSGRYYIKRDSVRSPRKDEITLTSKEELAIK